MTEPNIFGDVISTYTRKQAFEGGSLIDVSVAATQIGHKWPVAITQAVHEWLSECSAKTLQAEPGWEFVLNVGGASEKLLKIALDAAIEDLIRWSVHEIHVAGTNPELASGNLITNVQFGNSSCPMKAIWISLDGDDDRKPCWTLMFPEDY